MNNRLTQYTITRDRPTNESQGNSRGNLYESQGELVPDHDGGQPKQINAWFLYTHMVYL
jgi:hypothetical protein